MDSPDTEVAWVAGFYSGEGSTHAQRRKCVNGWRYYPNLCIGNTELEPLERCQRVMGGAIYGPVDRGPTRKPMYLLKVMKRDDVDRALALLLPWLTGEKRDQAARVMEQLKESAPVAERRGWPKGKPRGVKA